MSNWVEYWDKDKELVTVVGSYVPKKGDFVKLKLAKTFRMRKILHVTHEIDKTNIVMKEKFVVIVQ